MAISLANVATTDTFQTWLNTTNFLATYLTSSIVTVNSSFSSTTGNGAVVGSFGATTLFANSSLRGGNTSVSDTLNISSNTIISGTANVSGAANFTSSLTAANLTSSTNTATFGTAAYHVSNGNFGIGTSTPGYKLSVLGTSGTQQAQIGTATSYLNVTGYTSNPTYVVVGGGTATQGIFGSETNIPVAIYTNNTEKVRVTAAGNVGISNTAPTHRLSVNGTTFLGGTLTLGSGIVANGSSGTEGQILSSNGSSIYWATGLSGTVTSVSSGNGLTGGPVTTSGTISALANSGIVANSTGLHVLANTGVTSNSTGVFIGQAVATGSNVQFNSLGIGTAASATAGEIRATNNITAYYSDIRLKTNIHPIIDPLKKLEKIRGVTYINSEVAASFGYTNTEEQVGVIAQEVADIFPNIVKLAPFDTQYVDGVETSKSGEHYKTVQYEKLIPLLIEAVKELNDKLEELKKKVT